MDVLSTPSTLPSKNRAERYLRTYLVSFGFVAMFGLGVFFGRSFFSHDQAAAQNGGFNSGRFSVSSTPQENIDFQQFWTVWSRLKDRYVKEGVKDQELLYGSIQGLVASLNDPHSLFFPPKEAADFTKDISGEFEGIGAEIGLKNNQLVVISPLADSPAERAGLRAGDKILMIDKENTFGMDTYTAVTKIRGASGTPVTLTLGREKVVKPLVITIVRTKIIAPSFSYILKPGNIAYFRISQFNQDTVPLLDSAIEKLPKKLKGIVVDVRNDPGGYLQTAVQVASKWVPNGDMIVEEKGRTGIIGSSISLGPQPFAGIKTVVIINKGSASASEILAGALQDYGLATIVGETSYGKGSVQDLESFADGSALKLTIAEWYTPFGRNINKEGIKPDIEIKVDPDKEKIGQDTVLAKALLLITSPSSSKK